MNLLDYDFEGAHAGGPALLQLPIEGVSAENSDRCPKLLEKKFAPVLNSWPKVAVKMVVEGSTHLVQLRPELGQISLSEVAKVLEGSPFGIKLGGLECVGIAQLRIGKSTSGRRSSRAEVARITSVPTADGPPPVLGFLPFFTMREKTAGTSERSTESGAFSFTGGFKKLMLSPNFP